MTEKEIRLAVGGGSSSAAKLGNSKKKIHKLPPHLRSMEHCDVYDPKVVSIGPYHHGKPELQLVQGIKSKVLDHFISNSKKKKNYEFYFNKMLEVVHTARSCYIMENINSEFDDPQFAEMMLLDACFLLNYFLMTTNYGVDVAKALKYYSPLGITTLIDAAAGLFFTERDTLLLDNQIPLWIIELLFNARYGNANPLHTWKQLLSMRSQQVVWNEIVYENIDELEKHVMLLQHDDDDEALHLLEFYHMLMVSSPSSSAHSAEAAGSTSIMLTKELIHEYGYLFRSVMDLKSKGIHFSRNYTDYTLTGIKFDSNLLRAKVKLPFFDASTLARVSLQNMIAYELCNFTRTQFVVGSYINFMKSLIVSPGDVKELREKRIISTLGEDKEVVKLFHELNTYDFDNPIIFRDVKHKILKYYNSKTKTWMAELAYTYFRTPWTAIALFAATFLLVLTFLQTYFTIKP